MNREKLPKIFGRNRPYRKPVRGPMWKLIVVVFVVALPPSLDLLVSRLPSSSSGESFTCNPRKMAAVTGPVHRELTVRSLFVSSFYDLKNY